MHLYRRTFTRSIAKISTSLLVLAVPLNAAQAYRANGPCVESDDQDLGTLLRVELGSAPPWLSELDTRIKKAWRADSKLVGSVYCSFTVKPDGTIADFAAKLPNGEMGRLRKTDEVAVRSIVKSAIPLHSKPTDSSEKAVASVRFFAHNSCSVWARVFK